MNSSASDLQLSATRDLTLRGVYACRSRRQCGSSYQGGDVEACMLSELKMLLAQESNLFTQPSRLPNAQPTSPMH